MHEKKEGVRDLAVDIFGWNVFAFRSENRGFDIKFPSLTWQLHFDK